VPADDGAWWADLARPPPAAGEWPLRLLAASEASSPTEPSTWWLDRQPASPAPALCREASDDVWRALPDVSVSDVDARLRARTAAGESESYGLAFRQSDSADYYLARVDTRNNNVRLYRHEASNTTLLAARDLAVSVGQWHELAIHAAGTRLAVALDGEPQVQVDDERLRTGGIAVWAEPHSRVCFNRLWVAGIGAQGRGQVGPGANRE
jgi:hypothetical protein